MIDLCVPQEACHELFCVFGTFYASRTQYTGVAKSLYLAVLNFCSFYVLFLLSQSREVFCQLVQQMKNQHSEITKNQASVFIGTWNMGKIFGLANAALPFSWLNTVLWAVSSNSCDGLCFKLDKQTWRRKSNVTQKTISQNLLLKFCDIMAEFLLLSHFE